MHRTACGTLVTIQAYKRWRVGLPSARFVARSPLVVASGAPAGWLVVLSQRRWSKPQCATTPPAEHPAISQHAHAMRFSCGNRSDAEPSERTDLLGHPMHARAIGVPKLAAAAIAK